VSVDPGHYLASWQPESGVLFVPAFADADLGDEVAVQVGLRGGSLKATLLGQVSLVRRVGRPSLPPGAQLQLDEESRRTAGWLAAAAAGAPVDFRARPPRYVIAYPILVSGAGERIVPVQTANVSADGAALRWSGRLPAPGELVGLRLADRLFAPTADAVVAWVAPSGSRPPRVGVRVVAAGRAARAWARLAEDAERDGLCRL
jgi:Tfp pilus assembly protein PilZ